MTVPLQHQKNTIKKTKKALHGAGLAMEQKLAKGVESESNNSQVNVFNPLSTNPLKWSNTLKQFVGNLLKNCLSVFDQCVILVLNGLR